MTASETPLRRRVLASLAWNQLEKFALFGLGVILSVVIARSLGSAQYGFYASLLAVITIAEAIVSFGLENVLNVYVPKLEAAPGGTARSRQLVSRLLQLRVLLTLAASGALTLWAAPLAAWLRQPALTPWLRGMAGYVILLGVGSFFRMAFKARMNYRLVTTIEVISQAVFLAVAAFFLAEGAGLSGVLAGLVASAGVTVLLYGLRLRREASSAPEGPPVPLSLPGGYQLASVSWSVAVMAFVLGKQMDIVLMNRFHVPAEQIGHYALAFALVSTLYLFGRGLGPIAQSVFAEAGAKQGTRGLGEAFSVIYKINALQLIPTYVFAIVFAESIVQPFYGTAYLPAARLFQVFACLKVLYDIVAAASFCPLAFYVLERRRFVFWMRLGAGILNVSLDLLWIPQWGAMGAIVATGCSAAALGLAEFTCLGLQLRWRLPWLEVGKIACICAAAALLAWWVPGPRTMSTLMAQAGTYGAGLVLFSLALKPFGIRDLEMVESVNPWLGKWMAAVTVGAGSPDAC